MGIFDKIERVANKVLREILEELNISTVKVPEELDTNGNYFLHFDGENTGWEEFTLGTYAIPFWDGQTFRNTSLVYKNGYYGIGVHTPTQKLDVDGSVKVHTVVYKGDELPIEPLTDGVYTNGARVFVGLDGNPKGYMFEEDYYPIIDGKIDKPGATVVEPTNSYKYAVLLDENGSSVRMLAGNLGKNIYNSDGTLTENRSVNTGSYTLVFTNSGNNSKIGINKTPVEALDVSGRVAGNGFKFNSTSTVATQYEVILKGNRLVFNNGTMEKTLAYTDEASNIMTTDLTTTGARTHTQAHAFTWNTAGFFHYLKGLLDKTGNAAYTKVVVVHPTTGEMVTRDFADPQATTLAVQNANASQKTAMRTALLGTATPASPVINVVNTYYIKRNTYTMLILSGINLAPLDPTFIWIQNGAQRVDASSYFALSATGLQTFWTIPSDFPLGEYLVNLSFGAVTQGANIGKLIIVDEFTSLQYDFPVSSLILKPRAGYVLGANTTYLSATNTFRINRFSTNFSGVDNSYDAAIKTPNVFLGDVNVSWEVVLEITNMASGGHGANMMPFCILTETSDVDFISPDSIFSNYILIFAHNVASYISIRGTTGPNGAVIDGNTIGSVSTVVFRKSGNILTTYILNTTTGSVTSFVTSTIDTTKNYALAFIAGRNTNGPLIKDIKLSTSIYNP